MGDTCSARDDHADTECWRRMILEKLKATFEDKKYHINGTRKSPTASLLIEHFAFI